MEDWKTIDGYELYEVSNHGRVRRGDKILYLNTVKGGYKQVQLYKYCRKMYLVSRLVAQAFIPNPENKPFIDHIDRDPANNMVSNLRWVNRQENNLNRSTWRNDMRNIYERNGSYRVVIRRNKNIIYCKTFVTLEQAIHERDAFLQTELRAINLA